MVGQPTRRINGCFSDGFVFCEPGGGFRHRYTAALRADMNPPTDPPTPQEKPTGKNASETPAPRKPHPRDVRRLAMQAMYIIDATKQTAVPALREALDEPFDDGDPAVPDEPKAPAIELALAAWAQHAQADAQIEKLAPDWPTHRQPPVDRAILRLAWFELATQRNAPAIVINEAVELAKQFSDERAPAFINGVLDRLAKRLAADAPAATAPTTEEAWLDDANQPPG